MKVLSFEVLNQLLRYEPETGKLFWSARSPEMFNNGKHSREHNCSKWNAKFAGKEGFTSLRNGYNYGDIFGKKYQAHRIIWFVVNGSWPFGQIDHINGVRSDNRFKNFRVVTHAENGRNQCMPSNNTSGVVGVCWSRNAGKWQARAMRDGISQHLGYFDKFEDAVFARRKADSELDFHPNHGRAA